VNDGIAVITLDPPARSQRVFPTRMLVHDSI
jgi:hypothetical protein